MTSRVFHRREVLRLGSLSLFGSLAAGSRPAFGQVSPTSALQKNCILIFLQGGPSHIDLWDPKPDAPAEIRGPFATIDAGIPGVRFGELLPLTAKLTRH